MDIPERIKGQIIVGNPAQVLNEQLKRLNRDENVMGNIEQLMRALPPESTFEEFVKLMDNPFFKDENGAASFDSNLFLVALDIFYDQDPNTGNWVYDGDITDTGDQAIRDAFIKASEKNPPLFTDLLAVLHPEEQNRENLAKVKESIYPSESVLNTMLERSGIVEAFRGLAGKREGDITASEAVEVIQQLDPNGTEYDSLLRTVAFELESAIARQVSNSNESKLKNLLKNVTIEETSNPKLDIFMTRLISLVTGTAEKGVLDRITDLEKFQQSLSRRLEVNGLNNNEQVIAGEIVMAAKRDPRYENKISFTKLVSQLGTVNLSPQHKNIISSNTGSTEALFKQLIDSSQSTEESIAMLIKIIAAYTESPSLNFSIYSNLVEDFLTNYVKIFNNLHPHLPLKIDTQVITALGARVQRNNPIPVAAAA